MHAIPEMEQDSCSPPSVEEAEDDGLPNLSVYKLPNIAFDRIWESLHFGSSLRERLLHQMTRMMVLIRKGGFDPTLHNWNRLILL
jgi:hypothetical protein